MKKDFARGWLQGFFDADGGVVNTTAHKYVQGANTDKSIVQQATRCLTLLNIPHRITWNKRKHGYKDICAIVIESRAALSAFAKQVGFSCTYKMEKLSEVMAYKNRADAPRRIQPPSAEELRLLYWDRQLDLPMIAKQFGYRGSVPLLRLMQRYNIPTRSRSEALKLRWARRVRSVSCKRGHDLENWRLNRAGKRYCLSCNRERGRINYHLRKSHLIVDNGKGQ